MSSSREHAVIQAFVSLANALVDDFDVISLLSGLVADCAELLDTASAGLLLADEQGVLHVVAASTETARNLELLALQREEGPCFDAYRTGEPVRAADLRREASRWPAFVAAAEEAGFTSVHAVPLRLNGRVLGSLGLFGGPQNQLSDDDLHLAQALAHVASIAIVQGTVAADASVVSEQLQHALSSRVVIEQAKGIVAQAGGVGMEDAFGMLARCARDRNRRLAEVAEAVVSGALPAVQLIAYARSRTSGRGTANR